MDFGNHSSTKTCQIFGTIYSINYSFTSLTFAHFIRSMCGRVNFGVDEWLFWTTRPQYECLKILSKRPAEGHFTNFTNITSGHLIKQQLGIIKRFTFSLAQLRKTIDFVHSNDPCGSLVEDVKDYLRIIRKLILNSPYLWDQAISSNTSIVIWSISECNKCCSAFTCKSANSWGIDPSAVHVRPIYALYIPWGAWRLYHLRTDLPRIAPWSLI